MKNNWDSERKEIRRVRGESQNKTPIPLRINKYDQQRKWKFGMCELVKLYCQNLARFDWKMWQVKFFSPKAILGMTHFNVFP